MPTTVLEARLSRRSSVLLLVFSGCVPLLGLLGSPREVTLLIYTLFVLVVLRRRYIVHGWDARPPAGPLTFWLLLMGTGVITECLAWTNAYLKCDPAPALFHHQLAPDILLASGFYSTWAVAWIIAHRFFAFSLREAFMTQGLYGVVVEQKGAILLAGLASMPFGLVIWIFVFLVYGSTLGIPYVLARWDARSADDRRSNPIWKYVVAAVLLAVLLVPVSAGWGALLGAVGLIPPSAPVCERPLW